MPPVNSLSTSWLDNPPTVAPSAFALEFGRHFGIQAPVVHGDPPPEGVPLSKKRKLGNAGNGRKQKPATTLWYVLFPCPKRARTHHTHTYTFCSLTIMLLSHSCFSLTRTSLCCCFSFTHTLYHPHTQDGTDQSRFACRITARLDGK